ncbi:hypothetical protein MBRA1_001567 [Malassezia brasiliensis]|uniref:CAP-Gly domain-containing protein n=1 Tax=Malassezia brasiliensis TaxID=1821822 RepID=A0AAF0DVX2_9BASI|nr:hypothetical protein MBRA1_001567 [Malassezia brasiliensis]
MDSTARVGARLVYRGEYGTVRYVGPLPPEPGIWIGVAWDRTRRGKHDGVGPDGTRYFTTEPLHAGFVRASAPIQWGTTFLHALREKYEGHVRPWLSLTGGAPPPAVPDASSVYVASIDDADAIHRACADVTTIDLSYALLPSWSALHNLAAGVPHLDTLVLSYVCRSPSHTRLGTPTAPPTWPHLTHLALNATQVSWADVCALSPGLPRLGTLELAANGLSILGMPPPNALRTLHTLHLQDNALDMDSVVDALRPLPGLQRLILTQNSITSVRPTSPFPALHTLALQGNALVDWPSIEALESFFAGPFALTLDTPAALAADEHAFRTEVIARLGMLASLNHTLVSPEERQDAERYFLSHAPPDARSTPRYRALCAQHGMEPPVDRAPATWQNKLVHVGVLCLGHPPAPDEAATLLDASHAQVALLCTMPLRAI